MHKKTAQLKWSKNTIQLIIIVIVIICFGLAGLGLVIFNIKNDVKPKYDEQGHEVEATHPTKVMDSEMMHNDDPDDSSKKE